jgi:hypothetical protein
MNEITSLFRKYIISTYDIKSNVYSDVNKEFLNNIIKEFEECRIKNNFTIDDIHLTDLSFNTIPLFALINFFAHPIFIKYFIGTFYTEDFIKEKHKDIKEILKFLYIQIYYQLLSYNLWEIYTKDELFQLLDEYAKIFKVNYDKKTYGEVPHYGAFMDFTRSPNKKTLLELIKKAEQQETTK